jgi:glycogen debranching enzyme
MQVTVASLQFTAGLPGAGGKYRHIFPLLDREFFGDPAFENLKQLPSLAAGITHFCTGCMRSWGRDSMISLRGLVCSTGRHEYARNVLVATAAMLWNGLLPNLLDSGLHPRYNCRDSCWWFLQAVQDYCDLVPDGLNILHDNVPWLFVDSEPPVARDTMGQKRCMLTVLLDILEHHLNGVTYREHNAGINLDHDMRDEGFNVHVGVDARTGFVQGGHSLNCGTWMDKNGSFTTNDAVLFNLTRAPGSSTVCGNAGIPATPRDGSPIELVALQASALRWLVQLQHNGVIEAHIVVRVKVGQPLRNTCTLDVRNVTVL